MMPSVTCALFHKVTDTARGQVHWFILGCIARLHTFKYTNLLSNRLFQYPVVWLMGNCTPVMIKHV